MSKKIVFKARSRTEFHTQQRPFPATQAIPDWWKSMTPYVPSEDNPDGKKFLLRDRASNATFKKCRPMLDAITSGYIIPLWADVQVTQVEGYPPFVTWRTQSTVFDLHGTTSRQIPAPVGYDQIVYKYNNAWIPQTPPGYSVLISAPFGYRDLPFHAVPAIVDSDKSTLELVFPMWIKSGLEGIVENGTPMIQVTPFKREDWVSEFEYYEDGEYKYIIEERNFNKNVIGNYVKNHWSKKTYR